MNLFDATICNHGKAYYVPNLFEVKQVAESDIPENSRVSFHMRLSAAW
jgi:hypothetical protein